MTEVEKRVLQQGLTSSGVKVWSNQYWSGHEWEGQPISGATADTKDALMAKGHVQKKDGWGTLYETTEAGKAALSETVR